MHRAYSLINVKAFDPETRTFGGTATSPEPDRLGDVIESAGVTYKNPLPLLLYHDSKKPVGETTFGRHTKNGTPFNARISTIDRPGVVKDRLDEAVDSLRADPPLIRGVSIGFRPLEEPVYNKDTGGYRFTKIEVLEMSMVVIPAHQDATIATLKSLDAEYLAASGRTSSTSSSSAGVSASSRTVTAVGWKSPSMKKSYAEQIKAFENTRAAKVAELDALIEKSADSGETFDETEQQQHDDLEIEIAKIDKHLPVLRAAEQRQLAQAVEVKGTTEPDAQATRNGGKPVHVEVRSRLGDGLDFAAAVLCKAHAYVEIQKGNFKSAVSVAQERYPDNLAIQRYLDAPMQKTSVAAGTTSDSNWATALLEPNQILVNDFLEYLRPKTLIGRIPNLKRVPFNVTVQSQTSAASASWVGQGKGKPLTKFNTTTTSLAFTKIAAIAVITDELARFSRPGAETLVRDELAKAVIERMDMDFVDPAKAASAGVNPASITNGVTPGTTAGASAANALTDFQTLVVPFAEAKYPTSELVVLMPDTLAFALSLMLNTSGFRSYPDMTINGGSIGGIPVITSQYMASLASYGNMVVVLHAPSIAIADDGQVSIDVSREASIEMSDAPANETATPTASAYMVSMFQTNSVAIRAERVINWKKLRSDAVTWYDDVNWGSVGSPR